MKKNVIDPTIKAYYDSAPEETRLELGVFRLEALRSREIILRYLPEPPVLLRLDPTKRHRQGPKY